MRKGGRNRKNRGGGSRLFFACVAVVLLIFGAAFLLVHLLKQETENTATSASLPETETENPENREQMTKPPEFTGTLPVPDEAEEEASVTDAEDPGFAGATDYADRMLQDMTLEEKAAQLFFVTPEQLTGFDLVTQCGDVTYAAFDRYPVGGLIYFSKNLETEEQTKGMLQAVKAYALDQTGIPLFTGIDEEGGIVSRLTEAGFSSSYVPPMGQLALEGEAAVQEAGRTVGTSLRELGFNVDFAPVADVLTNPRNTVIGNRSFGEDPQEVARLADAFAKGLAGEQVLAAYKHFPGHGGTGGDTHEGYDALYKTKEELEEAELIPFADGVRKGVPMIMVAHISLPEVTNDNLPATLSGPVVTGILREELGYDGVVVTDALNMGAISLHYSAAESAVMALEAGCDLLLMPSDFTQSYEAVLEAVRTGRLSEARIDASVRRILILKYSLLS